MRVLLWSKYIVVALAALIAFSAARPASAQLGQVETQARQMILVDFDTDTVIFEKNADELMPPSSMSKLMTAFMVFEQLEAGKLRLDDMLPVSEKAWRIQGSKMFVPLGGRVKVEDLLRGVIIQSGNDACVVLAEGIAGTEERFAEMMTDRAHQLGLKNSTFRNASGWPDPQHLTTARDLAMLAKLIISRFPQHYHFYSEKEFTYGVDQVSKKPITQGNRNPLLYKDIGADGLKTGHTDAAGYGLTASVKRGDRRLIMVFNGLKSMNERSREAERLIELGFSQFDNYKLFTAGSVVDEADVWLGEAARIPLVIDRNLALTLPRQTKGNIKVAVTYENPIPAPIAKGTPVAKLTVTNRDAVVAEVPLLAGADVKQLGFTGRLNAAVSYLLWGAKKQ
ncbi:MAG: D-alanyl-D-alanine carboxypeptidase family protein [Ferrovibrio sp.]